MFQCLHQGRQQSRREALGHGQTHHALVGLLQQARLQVQLARLQGVGQIDAAQQPLAVHRAGNFHQPNAEAGQCLQPAFTHRAMRCPQAHAAKAVRVELQQLQGGERIAPARQGLDGRVFAVHASGPLGGQHFLQAALYARA